VPGLFIARSFRAVSHLWLGFSVLGNPVCLTWSPVYRALAGLGRAGLPAQSSGPCPLVLVPVCPAGRADIIGVQLLKDRGLPGRCRGARRSRLGRRWMIVNTFT